MSRNVVSVSETSAVNLIVGWWLFACSMNCVTASLFIFPVGRPIISGCDGPTERLSAFVDKLLQPIAKEQESYLKDSTDVINFRFQALVL